MIAKFLTVAAVAGAALTYTASANAMDFPAAPMNSGPPADLPGEHLVPGVAESMALVNTVTQPILQPILAPVGAPVAAAEPMVRHHHHHHMYMRHKMMMKKMMAKPM